MNIGFIPSKAARLAPDREGLIDVPNDRRMTYDELEQRVVKLANGILSVGVNKGDRISILSKNCIV